MKTWSCAEWRIVGFSQQWRRLVEMINRTSPQLSNQHEGCQKYPKIQIAMFCLYLYFVLPCLPDVFSLHFTDPATPIWITSLPTPEPPCQPSHLNLIPPLVSPFIFHFTSLSPLLVLCFYIVSLDPHELYMVFLSVSWRLMSFWLTVLFCYVSWDACNWILSLLPFPTVVVRLHFWTLFLIHWEPFWDVSSLIDVLRSLTRWGRLHHDCTPGWHRRLAGLLLPHCRLLLWKEGYRQAHGPHRV